MIHIVYNYWLWDNSKGISVFRHDNERIFIGGSIDQVREYLFHETIKSTKMAPSGLDLHIKYKTIEK